MSNESQTMDTEEDVNLVQRRKDIYQDGLAQILVVLQTLGTKLAAELIENVSGIHGISTAVLSNIEAAGRPFKPIWFTDTTMLEGWTKSTSDVTEMFLGQIEDLAEKTEAPVLETVQAQLKTVFQTDFLAPAILKNATALHKERHKPAKEVEKKPSTKLADALSAASNPKKFITEMVDKKKKSYAAATAPAAASSSSSSSSSSAVPPTPASSTTAIPTAIAQEVAIAVRDALKDMFPTPQAPKNPKNPKNNARPQNPPPSQNAPQNAPPKNPKKPKKATHEHPHPPQQEQPKNGIADGDSCKVCYSKKHSTHVCVYCGAVDKHVTESCPSRLKAVETKNFAVCKTCDGHHTTHAHKMVDKYGVVFTRRSARKPAKSGK